jgi:hypothetical protein
MGKEVDDQFGKWNKPNIGFLTNFVDAHGVAAKNQETTLKDYEEETKRTMERMLFMIEVLSIPAVAWLGAALELRVGAQIFAEYEDGFAAETGKYVYKKVANEFKAKIFGDAAKDLSDTLFKLTTQKIASEDPPAVEERKIALSPDFGVFGRNLYGEVDKQQTAVSNNISKIAQRVNTISPAVGDAVITRLKTTNPGFDRLPYPQQLSLGKKVINDLMQANRVNWAASWLFYGNDPPKPDWNKIVSELERQIWSVWVIQQDLHAEKYGLNLFTEDYKVYGFSGKVFDDTGGIASRYKTSPITSVFLRNSPHR